MAYSGTKIETWNRSTPRDGLLLDSEFSQLYDDIENYISGNSGAEPPYTLKELADGTVTFAGAKTFSSKITGSISGDCDGNAGTVTGGVYTSGDQTIAGVKTFSSTIVGSIDSIKETGTGAGTIRKKIIEIGDWNMATTAGVSKAHGLTRSKIRRISAIIYSDTGGGFLDYCFEGSGFIGVSDSAIALNRLSPGLFDNSSFDLTDDGSGHYNRGWITIEYVD